MVNDRKGNDYTDKHDDEYYKTPRNWRERRRVIRHEWREVRHRTPFQGLFLGLTLLLLGIIFLLDQTGYISGNIWWQALLIGLGIIAIIDGLVRYPVFGFRWGSLGRLLVGIVFVLIGTLLILGISQWWPVVIIAMGIVILLRFVINRPVFNE